jgi:tetratricopeptide (TPR) repeat protein
MTTKKWMIYGSLLVVALGSLVYVLISRWQAEQPNPLETAVTLYWDQPDNYDAQLAALDRVIETEPENAAAYAYRASVHRQLTNFAAANADLEVALSLAPNSALIHSMLGRLYYDQGWTDEGLAKLEYAVNLDSTDSVVYFNFGVALQRDGKPVAALKWLTRAIEIDDTRSAYYTARAGVHRSIDPDNTGDIYGDAYIATTLDPENALAYYWMAWSQRYRFREDALTSINTAIRLDRNDGNFYTLRGSMFLIDEKYHLAIADFDMALQVDPEQYYAMAYKALALETLGDLEGAVTLMRQAGPFEPTRGRIYYVRAALFREAGLYDKAIEQYQLALGYDPRLHEAALNLGNVYFETSRFEHAIDAYTRAINIWPGFGLAYSRRGEAYELLGDAPAALADMKHATEIQPEFARYWVVLGDGYREWEMYDEAHSAYTRAIEIDPTYGRAYWGRFQISGHLLNFNLAEVESDRLKACNLGAGNDLDCP